jgi:hypothetical protein
MSVQNRSLGPSEQKRALQFNHNVALTTGETGVLQMIPFPCVLEGAQVAAFSVVSDVNLMLTVSRFIVGTGVTTFNLGSTFAPPSFGTSGLPASGVSLPVSGNTLLLLMPNDIVGYQVGGGATAAIFGLAGSLVVRPLQDVKVFLGSI